MAISGNDIANGPQGQVMAKILAELRVHTVLLMAIASGRPNTDHDEELRSDAYIEPVYNELSTIYNPQL